MWSILTVINRLTSQILAYDPHGLREFEELLSRGNAQSVSKGKMTAKLFEEIKQDIDRKVDKKLTHYQTDENQLLGKKKLKNIRRLLRDFAAVAEPLSPEIKEKLYAFKILFERYEVLCKNLGTVKLALQKGDYEQIGDEIVDLPVSTPILLVKQYKKDDIWYAVPAASHVTDKNSILKWLILNPMHPLKRDSILKPELYKNMPTRYVWHMLTQDYCMAQELKEAAPGLRSQFHELQKFLEHIQAKRNTLSSNPQTLFKKMQAPLSASMVPDVSKDISGERSRLMQGTGVFSAS